MMSIVVYIFFLIRYEHMMSIVVYIYMLIRYDIYSSIYILIRYDVCGWDNPLWGEAVAESAGARGWGVQHDQGETGRCWGDQGHFCETAQETSGSVLHSSYTGLI